MNAIITKHSLDFEAAPWEPLPGFPPSKNFHKFRIGTCEGLWQSTDDSYDILAVKNNSPHNGHFEDVIQWFEHSCRRDKRNFRFLEVMNPFLKKHLIEKRGFKHDGIDNLKKSWRKCMPTV